MKADEVTIFEVVFVLGALVEHVFSPKCWENNSTKLYEKTHTFDMFGFDRLHHGFNPLQMQIRGKKHPRCNSASPRPVLKGPGAEK